MKKDITYRYMCYVYVYKHSCLGMVIKDDIYDINMKEDITYRYIFDVQKH